MGKGGAGMWGEKPGLGSERRWRGSCTEWLYHGSSCARDPVGADSLSHPESPWTF